RSCGTTTIPELERCSTCCGCCCSGGGSINKDDGGSGDGASNDTDDPSGAAVPNWHIALEVPADGSMLSVRPSRLAWSGGDGQHLVDVVLLLKGLPSAASSSCVAADAAETGTTRRTG